MGGSCINSLFPEIHLYLVSHNIETLAVVFTNAVVIDRFAVICGTIAFVPVPQVVWELFMQFYHVLIAVGLSQYACRRDACIDAVAFIIQ